MLDQASPFHGTYSRMMGKVYRITCEVKGFDGKGREVTVPADSLVEVLDAAQLAEPEYGEIDTGKFKYNGVVEDNVRLTVVLLTGRGTRRSDDVTYEGAAACMLEPEPGVVVWPQEFSRQANLMGWDVFYCDGSEGPLWQLQAVYEEGRFVKNGRSHDQAAWEFVWEKAVDDDDPVCLAALAFLRHRAPKEYKAIREHCLKAVDQ